MRCKNDPLFSIRKYNSQRDFKHVKELYNSVFRQTFFFYDNIEIDFLKDTEGECISICEVDSCIVGFISVYEELDYDFLHHLYIRQDFIGMGVGEALLKKIKKDKKLLLKCSVKNEKALQFYLKNGFKIGSYGISEKYQDRYALMELT